MEFIKNAYDGQRKKDKEQEKKDKIKKEALLDARKAAKKTITKKINVPHLPNTKFQVRQLFNSHFGIKHYTLYQIIHCIICNDVIIIICNY